MWVASYTVGATPALTWQSLGGIVTGKPSIGPGPAGPIVTARDGAWGYYVWSSGVWQRMPGLTGVDPVVLANTTATAYLAFLDQWSTLYYLPLTVTQSGVTPGSLATAGTFVDFSPTYYSGQLGLFGRDPYGTIWFGAPGSSPMGQIGMGGIVISPLRAARY